MESSLATSLEPPLLPSKFDWDKLRAILEEYFAGLQTVMMGQSVGDLAQALTGAGPIDLNTLTTKWTTTAADAATLADGFESQVKSIVMVAHGGNGTLTPDNLGAGTTITFDAVGDSVTLQFLDGNWWVLSNNNAVVA